MQLSPEVIEKLKNLASKKTYEEKNKEEFFDATSWFGGNCDDAYDGGIKTGEITLARNVLTELGIDF